MEPFNSLSNPPTINYGSKNKSMSQAEMKQGTEPREELKAVTLNGTDSQHVTSNDMRYPDVVKRHRPGQITDVQVEQQTIVFTTDNQVQLVLQPITHDIIHLKYYMDGDVRTDFTYTIDPNFRPGPVDFHFDEYLDRYELKTDTVTCIITKDRTRVHFYDADGNVLCEDQDGFYRRDSLMKGISEVKVTKQAPEGVRYFGLGDKTFDAQDLRGREFENWNTDAYGYDWGDDPLYRSIPFYMALIEGRGYGIFLDNTFRTRFSFDHKGDGVSSFSAEGGVMSYYFINGPELTTVAERYVKLTGTPELPPMWAMGYHQCRWSYYPESRVREVAQKFRELDIPCDSIYLDIDYMNEFRCFTWDDEFFPDPEKMLKDLKEQGFKTVVIVDPGIKQDHDYSVFKEGMEKGYFCRRPDGEIALAPVWPQDCGFPDFTHPDVREWWARLNKDFITDYGIGGIWIDMNEPAVFEVDRRTLPEDIRHDYDGHPCSHKKAHNVYGMQMARASLKGIKQANPDKRPFLLTRANFAGGQRYATIWTGDNFASWGHLRLANEQCIRLSISGFSFVGTDVGGFAARTSGELFARWLQLSIFHPFFRNHAMGFHVDGASAVAQDKDMSIARSTTTDREPWTFGERYTAINRKHIELRYRLLGYLYTAFKKYVDYGTPVIRPLGYYDQTDTEAFKRDNQFLFGDHIVVVPVFEKGQTRVEAYLPKGSWYHFWNHKKYEGRDTHEVAAPMEEVPFFVKAGTVLPLREVVQYIGERDPEKLDLNIYYSEEYTESRFYEDAEEGYDYRKGGYRETTFCAGPHEDGKGLVITAKREGAFIPPYKKMILNFIGLPFEPVYCEVDGERRELSKSEQEGVYQLAVSPDFKNITLE